MSGGSDQRRYPIVTAIVVALGGTTIVTPLLPLYSERGVPTLDVTGAFALYGLVVLAVLLFGARVIDRVGRRTALQIGLAIGAVAALGLLLSVTTWMLFVNRVLSGVSAGILVGTANAFLLAQSKGSRSAGALPAVATGVGLGIGPVAGGLVSQNVPGPLVASYIVNIVAAVAAIGLLLLVPNSTADSRSTETGPHIDRSRRAMFVEVAPLGFGGFLAFGIYSATTPSLLGDTFTIDSRAVIGIVVGVFFLASALGPLLGRVLSGNAAVDVGGVMIVVGLAAVGVGTLLVSLPTLIVGGILTGIGQGVAMDSGLSALTADLDAKASWAITLAYFVVLYIGVSVPVIVIGLLNIVFPLAVLTVVGCLAAALLIAVVAVTGARSRSRSSRQPA